MTAQSRRLLAIAAGFLVAGAGALVVASWILSDDLADLGPGRAWLGALTIVQLVGIAALGGLGRRFHRPLAGALAVVAAGTAAWSTVGFLDQYDAGFPGQCTLLAAIGGAAVLVGALLTLPLGAWQLPRPRSAIWPVTGLAVVAAVSTPMLLTAPGWRLTSTTSATAPGQRVEVPDTVTRVAWSTEVDGRIKDVQPGGPGAIVLLSDGVLGVDGTTGAIRWSRRRAGAEAEQIDVSPDGRSVVVQMSPADRFPVRREVLDAATGKLRFSVDSANSAHSPGFLVPMTDVSYIRANSDQTEFYGDSLADGRTLWTFRAPAGCRIIPDRTQQFAQAHGMLLPLFCDHREFRYVSVDARTGRIRWQHVVRLSGASRSIETDVERSTDHELARVNVADAVGPRYALLDTDTGEVLPAPSPLDLRTRGIAVAGAPEKATLIDVRDGRVLAGRGAVLTCAMDAGPALLKGGALCLDQSRKPFEDFESTGAVKVAAAAFGSPDLRPLTVRLGGPFVENGGGSELFQSIPVPGAVVAYSTFQPQPHHRSALVGLR